MKSTDFKILDKILSQPAKRNIAAHLNGTGNKLEIIDNTYGENKTQPHWYIIQIFNKDGKKIVEVFHKVDE